jgi:DNA repair photolyase
VELTCRSVMNWVQGRRLGDFYSVNPYRGCAFGCLYCYARYTHEFFSREAPPDFERQVYVKLGAPEAFARDLKRATKLSSGIHFGSATDPYQPAEARFQLTRQLLERLLPYRDVPIGLATKSALVERDADVLAELARRNPVKVIATCVTLDAGLQRALEPQAPPVEKRLAALAKLAARGVPTGMLLAPIMPFLNDGEAELRELCDRAREAGVGSVATQVLFLPGPSKRRFFPWLAEHRPEHAEWYRRAYRGRELAPEVREKIQRRVERVVADAGLSGERR